MVLEESADVARRLGHFPSSTELKAMGRNDLMCAITKHGGFLNVSGEIGIARLSSDSDVGWKGEDNVRKKLIEIGYRVDRRDALKSPYDLIVDGRVRVDVKAASYAEYGACRGWFYRNGKHVQSDIVILHQLDTGTDYVLYWWEVNASNITISRGGGKYASAASAYAKIREFNSAISLIGKRA